MRRILLDANIYGLIIERNEAERIKDAVKEKRDIAIYGNSVIRKELRNISKDVLFERRKLRILITGLYDRIVKDSIVISRAMEYLAEDYYKVYSSLELISVGTTKSEQLVHAMIYEVRLLWY